MYFEIEKVQKARGVMQKLAEGMNPLSGEQIGKDDFLCDARMAGCFNFIAEVLESIAKHSNESQARELKFVITPEQKGKVALPEGKIGVNEFSKRVNECLNLDISKRLTGVELNKRLKKLGVLSEENLEEGRARTITNEKSTEYGFEMEKRKYNGVEYDMVLINNTGKKYLLDNLENIMAVEL
jgi:hypothetical protein